MRLAPDIRERRMARIVIEKCKNPEAMLQVALEQSAITDAIRQRAFGLFQNRAGGNGSDLDDWLRAERDLVWAPATKLVEGEKEFQARITLPEVDAKDIRVCAMPDALVIKIQGRHTHENKIHWFGLPASIDIEKVRASLDDGTLRVIAPKAVLKVLATAAGGLSSDA
jgi:HSP20 family molecular chaperone IbpA